MRKQTPGPPLMETQHWQAAAMGASVAKDRRLNILAARPFEILNRHCRYSAEVYVQLHMEEHLGYSPQGLLHAAVVSVNKHFLGWLILGFEV